MTEKHKKLSELIFVFSGRVHELFLYNDDLKKAKFRFGEFITHRNPETNDLDMKVSSFNTHKVYLFNIKIY